MVLPFFFKRRPFHRPHLNAKNAFKSRIMNEFHPLKAWSVFPSGRGAGSMRSLIGAAQIISHRTGCPLGMWLLKTHTSKCLPSHKIFRNPLIFKKTPEVGIEPTT